MIKYARYISETSVAFPTSAEFKGVIGWEDNETEMRAHGYLPLVGVPNDMSNKMLTGFALVSDTISRTVTRYHEVTDYEAGVEVGKHIEPYEVTIEQDASYIRVTSYTSENVPSPKPRPAKEDISQQLMQVTELIRMLAVKYDAVEDLMQMNDMNIENLDKLIERKHVTSEDKNIISYKIQMVVLDLMGKLDKKWYEIWNSDVKPVLAQMFAQPSEEGDDITPQEE